ncbi:hypothetical protein [Marinicella sp. W31]|uniref:hypothetical protein n=1 Tax=Marinicella sp. W31 TaxID=3023713 RepID=UPI0037564364
MKIILLFLTFFFFDVSCEEAKNGSFWDIDSIYPTNEAWENEKKELYRIIDRIDSLRTIKPTEFDQLSQILSLVSDARSIAGKMAKVGLLQSSVNSKSSIFKKRYQEGRKLENYVEFKVSFLKPLILSMNESKVRTLMIKPELSSHKRRLLRILKMRKYTPNENLNMLLIEMKDLSDTSSDYYNQLISSDSFWPSIKIDNETHIVKPSNYNQIYRRLDNKQKKELEGQYYQNFNNFAELFKFPLLNRVKMHQLQAKAHNLPSSIDWLLTLNDGFEPGFSKNYIQQIRNMKPFIQSAVVTLIKIRGVESINYNDLFQLTLSIDKEISQQQAIESYYSFSLPFGEEYEENLRLRLAEPWLHSKLLENKGFTIGVFWQVGDTLANGIMPYMSDYRSARTLSALIQLMMGYRSVLKSNSPDRREEDFPVFGNVLFYLGSHLFDEHWIKNSENLDEKKVIHEIKIISLFKLIYKGAMITEFEQIISVSIANNVALSTDDISEIYYTLLVKYFGDLGFPLPEYLKYEWINEGVIFYGPNYITWSISNAIALYLGEEMLRGNESIVEIIKNGMGASQLHFTSEILKLAKIDFSTSLVIDNLKRAYQKIFDQYP